MGKRTFITLLPAYGRDYKSAAAVLADWNAGKDFRDSVTGQYCNKTDAIQYGKGQRFSVRYRRLSRIVNVPTE